jgi:formylglycine-generating enzyme required for sulfatase activity
VLSVFIADLPVMPDKPRAFLSYAHADDEWEGGAITAFRDHLAGAFRAVTGRPLEIFQDRDGMAWGQHWPDTLDKALGESTFLIPILTSNFFMSEHCRGELRKFLEHEAKSGRSDLILPVYWIECDHMGDAELREQDDLAGILHKRQYHDWRGMRGRNFKTRTVKQSLEDLARDINKALRRSRRTPGKGSAEPKTAAPEPAPPEPSKPAPEPSDTAPRSRRAAVKAPAAAKEATPPEPAPAAPQPAAERSDEVIIGPDAASLPDLSLFRDRPDTPEMVILPSDSFMMGSPEGEGFSSERPQHRVTIGYRFAVGRYPVTFEEYDRFAECTGVERPNHGGSGLLKALGAGGVEWRNHSGLGRERWPVINVSWQDAQAYVRWLSETTGQTYRLLSEAEWEYAARAGTTTRYWWGDGISPENVFYPKDISSSVAMAFCGPDAMPVGSYAANPWKLFDVHGIVREWVEDCWNESYQGAPADGSAWTTGDCSRRVLRGGSWLDDPVSLRAAIRDWLDPGDRYSILGFRVARTIR